MEHHSDFNLHIPFSDMPTKAEHSELHNSCPTHKTEDTGLDTQKNSTFVVHDKSIESVASVKHSRHDAHKKRALEEPSKEHSFCTTYATGLLLHNFLMGLEISGAVEGGSKTISHNANNSDTNDSEMTNEKPPKITYYEPVYTSVQNHIHFIDPLSTLNGAHNVADREMIFDLPVSVQGPALIHVLLQVREDRAEATVNHTAKDVYIRQNTSNMVLHDREKVAANVLQPDVSAVKRQ